jgi:RNA polymerase sigma-70 factor (ECF subfamily)
MQDQIIVEKLFGRSEEGLTLLDSRYRRLSLGVMAGILDNAADREECYNDLLLAIWNSIPPQRPLCLEAYVCALSRRIAIDRYRRNTRDKRNAPYTLMLSELEDGVPDTPCAEDEDGVITAAINDFLKKLDPTTRVLFVRRYIRCESVEELAARFDMSPNAVSSRLYRARVKLCKYLYKENIRI